MALRDRGLKIAIIGVALLLSACVSLPSDF